MHARNEQNTDDLGSWLKLWRIPGVGPKQYAQLLEAFDHPSSVFDANAAQLRHCGCSDSLINAIQQTDDSHQADLDWLQASAQHHVLTLRDARYPSALLSIADPPPLLFVIGDAGLLNWPQLAIVGSRNPTRGGADNAQAFARDLASRGLGITSGMALGIDAAAHRGALEAEGITVAVTGTGLDRVYPAQHRALAHQIGEHGAIVSEFPIGTAAKPQHFPRRNRIISGMSLGTLVVEAATQSGSLITARLASEQGREVFALPGSIHNPMARGCHALIRQGAKLVETANDILEELAPYLPATKKNPISSSPTPQQPQDAEQLRLLDVMGFDPISVDELVNGSGLTVDVISSMLLSMELDGLVYSLPGGKYCRHH